MAYSKYSKTSSKRSSKPTKSSTPKRRRNPHQKRIKKSIKRAVRNLGGLVMMMLYSSNHPTLPKNPTAADHFNRENADSREERTKIRQEHGEPSEPPKVNNRKRTPGGVDMEITQEFFVGVQEAFNDLLEKVNILESKKNSDANSGATVTKKATEMMEEAKETAENNQEGEQEN